MNNARRLVTVAIGLSASVTLACAKPHFVTAAPDEVPLRPGWLSSRLTTHVVLVSIDGLRPDAIGRFRTPTLDRLMLEGSFTLTASTITPSKTLPSHTSMLTGQPPERHGVLWNTVVTADADIIELPNVFGVARSHGYRTAAFFSKAKFQPLQRPGTLDYSQAPGGLFGRWSSAKTVADVSKHLSTAKPNLLFVHLSDPDRAGHSSGWMSAAYGRAVTATDSAIRQLLAAADRSFGEGNYTVIVTADHGGHDFDHGSADALDVRIPWIAWGRGVKAGQLQETAVQTIDTASTVLWLLGVVEPLDWPGSPVLGAFQASRAANGS
jgi:arylsulfatase A-like enzyme